MSNSSMFKKTGSRIYGGIQSARAAKYADGRLKSEVLPCDVICVGNLTAGGTGKTPMIMYLARLLQKNDLRVVILSRGYKGSLEKSSGVVSNTEKVLLGFREAGDEPYLLACRLPGVPVIVGRDRYQNGLLALRMFDPDVILLDDGFQHLQLTRDLNLLLMDTQKPLDNGQILPGGMLREDPSAVNRADAVVFTRSPDGQGNYSAIAPYVESERILPHFVCRHKNYCYWVPKFSDLSTGFVDVKDFFIPAMNEFPKAFVFSGLARNESFVESLKAAGVDVVGSESFPDHYTYTTADIENLNFRARGRGAKIIVTTEKDHARIQGSLDVDMVVLGVELDFFSKASLFNDYILNTIGID